MADFSEICRDISRKIATEHLDDLEDVESFGKVCSLWRTEVKDVDYTNFIASKNTQMPWLMLVDSPTNSYRRYYSLSKRMFLKINLPRFDDDPYDHRRYFSSKGWLIGVSMKRALITLFNFSGNIITPPSIPLLNFMHGNEWDDHNYEYQFHKFIFSGNPSDDNFQVAMIFDSPFFLAFWRPGQQYWVIPPVDDVFSHYQIHDVCFFRGQFYAIDQFTNITVFRNNNQPHILANLRSLGIVSQRTYDNGKYYIVVSGTSSLLVIHRDVHISPDNDKYSTTSFLLFDFNVDNGKATQVYHNGNRALFIGHNSTFFVDAFDHPRGCGPNSIYFTDDSIDYFNINEHLGGGGIDMGIYSLEENKVVGQVYQGPSQFSFETTPLWVELPHS